MHWPLFSTNKLCSSTWVPPWLIAQKPWIVPIPGTTKLHRLEENLGAVNVELTEDDLRRIDAASSLARGARYSEGAQKMIDR